MRRGLLLSCALGAMLPTAAVAEDGKLDISFEIRARVETIDGQFRPGIVPSDTVLLVRSLLFAEYDAGPIRIGGEILDARGYFERTRSSISTSEVDAIEPIQAYVAADLAADAKLVAGRFTFSLGSRRLISRNGFRNTINAFNGAYAIKGDQDRGATLFWLVPLRRLPDDIDGIRDAGVRLDSARGSPRLWGAFVHDKLAGTTVETYAIRLAENDVADVATRDRHIWTAGGRILRPPAKGRLDYEIESAFQWGHTRQTTAATDRTDRRVRAGFVSARTGFTFARAWQPRLSFAIDAATGDGPGPGYTRFDPLYSSRVFDFGPTSFYGPLTRANILSLEARLEAKPDKRTDAQIALRPLWLDSPTDSFAQTGVRDPAGAAGRYGGVQFDARIRRALIPDRLRLAIGGAILAKGRFLRDAANAPQTGDTHYGYVELTANF